MLRMHTEQKLHPTGWEEWLDIQMRMPEHYLTLPSKKDQPSPSVVLLIFSESAQLDSPDDGHSLTWRIALYNSILETENLRGGLSSSMLLKTDQEDIGGDNANHDSYQS